MWKLPHLCKHIATRTSPLLDSAYHTMWYKFLKIYNPPFFRTFTSFSHIHTNAPFHFVLSSQHPSFVRISSPSQHQNLLTPKQCQHNSNIFANSHCPYSSHLQCTQHTIHQYKFILSTQQQEQSHLPLHKSGKIWWWPNGVVHIANNSMLGFFTSHK